MPKNPTKPVWHFVAGIGPAAVAALLLLIHALQPIVDHDRQGYLFIVSGGLIAVSLAVWVWCVVQGVAAKFEARDEAADARQQLLLQQIADNHAEYTKRLGRLANTFQAIHGRLKTTEQSLAALERRYSENGEEIEHLRALILQGTALAAMGTKQLGPRPVGRQSS